MVCYRGAIVKSRTGRSILLVTLRYSLEAGRVARGSPVGVSLTTLGRGLCNVRGLRVLGLE